MQKTSYITRTPYFGFSDTPFALYQFLPGYNNGTNSGQNEVLRFSDSLHKFYKTVLLAPASKTTTAVNKICWSSRLHIYYTIYPYPKNTD